MALEAQKFDEDNGLLDEDGLRPAMTTKLKAKPSWKHHTWIALTGLNILLACISFYAILLPGRCNSQTQGWDTELADARGAIEYERRSYTGALTYSHDKGGVTRLNDGEMEFFGPPSARIDEAWKYLLHGEFPAMTEEEAEPFKPDLQPLLKTHKYHFEYARSENSAIRSWKVELTAFRRPDMFHNLHCVNAVRMELGKTLYNGSDDSGGHQQHKELPEWLTGPGWKATHLEHCLDRLRQAIMCHGDLTPSPLYTFEGYHVALGRSGKHMCRKFEPIRQWMDERAERLGVVGDI